MQHWHLARYVFTVIVPFSPSSFFASSAIFFLRMATVLDSHFAIMDKEAV
jgi:hypothetical protein